jgi:hypothetical protein
MQSEEAVAARHGKYNPPDLASKWGFELWKNKKGFLYYFR